MPQINLLNPYLSSGYTWLKGNLHTHTTFSDGVCTPQEIIAAYERLGYDFLAISDHDTWIVPDDYQHLTPLVLIPAVEVTALGPHVQQVGGRDWVSPDSDRQNVIDQINKAGGLAVMNHPNWEWHFSHYLHIQMEDLRHAAGLEIYNGVIERLEGSALATDRWDRLLSIGRNLWGFANDDAHELRDVGVAWNVVQARSRARDDILLALRNGQFYASTGVQVNAVMVDGRTITIQTENAQRIRFVTRHGAIRATFESANAEWQLPDNPAQATNWRYVRIECYGAGGRMAWTQPIKINVH